MCSGSTHTAYTHSPHRHSSAYVCLAALALCVCTRFRMCVPGEHMRSMHVCSSVSVCECACVSVHADQHLGRRCVCGLHACLWNVFMACTRSTSVMPGPEGPGADSPHQRAVIIAAFRAHLTAPPPLLQPRVPAGVCLRVLWAGPFAAHGAEAIEIQKAPAGTLLLLGVLHWLEVCSLWTQWCRP